ncbi:hypothetical protein, partial [Bacteroides caecimuris]|uniref:hypothetical protein n=1 Tax=Bacteroides caecimuris TaxID=1796613 RepID=UPI001ABF5BDA
AFDFIIVGKQIRARPNAYADCSCPPSRLLLSNQPTIVSQVDNHSRQLMSRNKMYEKMVVYQ